MGIVKVLMAIHLVEFLLELLLANLVIETWLGERAYLHPALFGRGNHHVLRRSDTACVIVEAIDDFEMLSQDQFPILV